MKSETEKLPFAVISVYNDNPGYLLKYFEEVIIMDNSDIQQEWNEKSLRAENTNVRISYSRTPNPGHSLRNFLDYITDNYDNLPHKFALLKSNIVPRHVNSEEIFLRLLQKNCTTPLFHQSQFRSNGFQETLLMPNFYLERNNSSYINATQAEYFNDFNRFLNFIFRHPIDRDWIPFAPGACYLVDSSDCTRRPKAIWEFLSLVSSYKYFPPEAYFVERVLLLALTSIEETHIRFSSKEWMKNLEDEKSSLSQKARPLRERVKSALLDFSHRI